MRQTDRQTDRANSASNPTNALRERRTNQQTIKPRQNRTSSCSAEASIETFVFEDEDGRLGCGVAVDNADLNMVVDADVNGLLTSAATTTAATDGRASLARHLSDGRVHSTHALLTG